MDIIAEVLSFEHVTDEGVKTAQVKADGEGGAPLTFEHLGAPGDDGAPLPGDTVVAVVVPGSGHRVAVGYADTDNAGIALPGERRLYGRDAAGVVVCAIHLKRDGSIVVQNDNGDFTLDAAGALVANVTTLSVGNGAGSMTLDSAGTWNFNGLTISAAGELTNAAGIVLGTHTHPITGGSSQPGPTGGPT